MTPDTDAMVQALFDKPSLEACSLQQLDYLAHQYPYFSAAQLLLLQKTKEDAGAYAAHLERAALHVTHPLQLHYWLQPAAFETTLPEAVLFQNPISDKAAKEVLTPKPDIEEAPETISSEAPDAVAAWPAKTQDALEINSAASNEIIETEETIEQPETETAEFQNEALGEKEIVAAHAVAIPETAEASQPIAAPAEPEAKPALLQETGSAHMAAVTFEPYHTVDYFASQGIKLSQQEATNDTLGKQLKSFTEWLKTMKRLPEATTAQPADSAGERRVESLAAHSLDTPDVVTESMAEVWLKQGNTEKAADVYNKLSLRHPSKSAYFAAKIESLKKS